MRLRLGFARKIAFLLVSTRVAIKILEFFFFVSVSCIHPFGGPFWWDPNHLRKQNFNFFCLCKARHGCWGGRDGVFLCFFKGIFWQMVVEEYFVIETGLQISIGSRKKDQFFWMDDTLVGAVWGMFYQRRFRKLSESTRCEFPWDSISIIVTMFPSDSNPKPSTQIIGDISLTTYSTWWFQTFLIFTNTWGNDPIWLMILYNFQLGWNHQLVLVVASLPLFVVRPVWHQNLMLLRQWVQVTAWWRGWISLFPAVSKVFLFLHILKVQIRGPWF